MNLTIPSGYYIEKSIAANKKIIFSPSVMHDNVLGFGNIAQESTEGFFVFLKSDFYKGGYSQVVDVASTVYLVCLLKWNQLTKIEEDTYQIVIGEGTGKDFPGKIGAQIQLSFSKDGSAEPNESNSPANGFAFYPLNLFGNNPGEGYYISTHKPINTDAMASFQASVANNNTLHITVDKDENGQNLLEESLDLLVYNGAYDLQHTIKSDQAGTVSISYHSNEPIFILPLVRLSNGDTFAIGDPETDAKVKVTESDV